jgi:hypothetical protein
MSFFSLYTRFIFGRIYYMKKPLARQGTGGNQDNASCMPERRRFAPH